MGLENAYRTCEAISRTCARNDNGIARNLQTFNYVYRYLDNWASVAEVSTEVREQIATLNEAISKLNTHSMELCQVIQEYVNSQLKANGQQELQPLDIVG